MFGSAAIMLAWVACGRVTAYFEADLNSWDTAAGALLVSGSIYLIFSSHLFPPSQIREAGGRMTNLVGEEYGPFEYLARRRKSVQIAMIRRPRDSSD
jgi:myo-inositol-1(or 4)-monophosphatase